ncbi:MAG: FKBP-type peptidyl-prolyl cis-trans isomerase [Actinobacteria bacterium]|nr:FKBP-type peptidyl-prolyl cis-trans isomerase [Actinomycetota bacterium]MBU1493945.1 FKBP-type peptidyl-prolyl cis-trans isomerase [Actinomycetota bacterium]MBU1866266.1 FKBP-type peptidyl-prolyl cis-trans isomerase [Actinomycetota bacterium]
MRRVALLIALSLVAAACGGTADDSATTTLSNEPDGEVTTTAARSEPGIPGVASSGDLVSVDYTGTLTDGTQFDSSIGRQPLQFTIDAGQMIQGFNDAVIGMAVGESKTVTLPPEQAYGDYSENLIIDVAIDQVPEGIAAGDELVSAAGQVVTVVAVTDTSATIDTNHSLAGETLVFEITLVSIDG